MLTVQIVWNKYNSWYLVGCREMYSWSEETARDGSWGAGARHCDKSAVVEPNLWPATPHGFTLATGAALWPVTQLLIRSGGFTVTVSTVSTVVMTSSEPNCAATRSVSLSCLCKRAARTALFEHFYIGIRFFWNFEIQMWNIICFKTVLYQHIYNTTIIILDRI